MSDKKENVAYSSGLDALRKRSIPVAGYYDILENDVGELLFTLKYLEAPLKEGDKPVMYYDGGPHAILMKNNEAALICDMIHAGVRGTLEGIGKVLIGEFDDGKVMEEYFAEMRIMAGIEDIADEHIEANRKADTGW